MAAPDPENETMKSILAGVGALCLPLALGSLAAGQDEKPSASVADQQRVVTRIGIVGCHQQSRPAPALSRYVEAKPDLVLWVGDNVYADTKDDINFIKSCYAVLEGKPAFQELRKQSIFMAGWDDHDYGLNNTGKNYPLKQESKALFRRFWKNASWIPEDRDGVYHSRTFGARDQALQVIVLDPRFNRDDEGEDSDTLGENQWKWLEAELRESAALRLVVSGYQVLLDRESKFETWAKFPRARQRLFDLIKKTEAENVIFITGDQHYGEVLRVDDSLGYDAVEFMFSGINQEEPHVYATHRVSPVAHARDSYALIDVQWKSDSVRGDNADPAHVTFRCFDAWKQEAELTYRVNLSELKSPQR